MTLNSAPTCFVDKDYGKIIRMIVSSPITERSNRIDIKEQVYEILMHNTFTYVFDAWERDPDPKKISWHRPNTPRVTEKLDYDNVEACQHVVDEMQSQVMLLTVCGETCVVKNDVIGQLKVILGR